MRIGLDFDNTIVKYDDLFHKVALEKGCISQDTPINKLSVRNYLRNTNQESVWTEMQGCVYGARMDEASPYPGVIEALNSLKLRGHELFIVSHKTKYPYVGAQYDLHDASHGWISKHLKYLDKALIDCPYIFFNSTKEEKIEKISELGCDIFLDDLPEILLASKFPENTRRCLFDPEGYYNAILIEGIVQHKSWKIFSNWVAKMADTDES